MEILVIDQSADLISALESRVNEAVKQSGLRRVQLESCDLEVLKSRNAGISPDIVFVGPGCFENCEEVCEIVRNTYPRSALGIILQNDTYALEAVKLRRALGLTVMPVADIASISSFLLDNQKSTRISGRNSEGIVAVAQLKGGVGASTLAAAMATCWAEHELSVVLVDLDDINPQLTDWARIPSGRRSVVTELMKQGQVPVYRLSECLANVEGEERSISIVGQPENYHESFHFKADVIEGAPSSQAFIESLLPLLQDNFDVVVVDLGRSWGISHFATLPFCQDVVLVTDDDAMSLRRTIDSLRRLSRETDDSGEFDFAKWRLVMNGYSSKLLQPDDVSDECDDCGLFPESMPLHTIQFSESGRKWGAPGVSFYDLAEEPVRSVIRELTQDMVRFKRGEIKVSPQGVLGKMKKLAGL